MKWVLVHLEMIFSFNENENFLWKNCLPFKYTQIFKIWDHLVKLCFETSTNIGHLAQKPWTFIPDSSFWEDFSNRFALFQVCWFVWLLWHKLGCNAEVLHFFDFFLNCLSTCKTIGGSLMKWVVVHLEMIFWKIKRKLSSTCSSNFTLFQLNQRQFVFFSRGV